LTIYNLGYKPYVISILLSTGRVDMSHIVQPIKVLNIGNRIIRIGVSGGRIIAQVGSEPIQIIQSNPSYATLEDNIDALTEANITNYIRI
jgi:hypothetical protein